MPTIRVSQAQLIKFDPCGLEWRLKLFGDKNTLTAQQAYEAGFPIEDLIWIAAKLNFARKLVKWGLWCLARVVITNGPVTPTTQAAINAAQAWLDDPTEPNRLACVTAAANANNQALATDDVGQAAAAIAGAAGMPADYPHETARGVGSCAINCAFISANQATEKTAQTTQFLKEFARYNATTGI